MDLSNLMFFCEHCNAPVRVGYKIAADQQQDAGMPQLSRSMGNE